ncbi:hypothetical protein [Streptomyces harbinensis]|uniref:Uncharacterized protein n=1 Tax=Streptomyces harbinensis TaxID=1176198 RepID=A0A1I6VHA4_9ACTN|nr:hypothetical protein [Streptomyces harbinensis]SFT13126.1 hypothetical protein SAMN05444716_10894 [Streptomyces harbinensis]
MPTLLASVPTALLTGIPIGFAAAIGTHLTVTAAVALASVLAGDPARRRDARATLALMLGRRSAR